MFSFLPLASPYSQEMSLSMEVLPSSWSMFLCLLSKLCILFPFRYREIVFLCVDMCFTEGGRGRVGDVQGEGVLVWCEGEEGERRGGWCIIFNMIFNIVHLFRFSEFKVSLCFAKVSILMFDLFICDGAFFLDLTLSLCSGDPEYSMMVRMVILLFSLVSRIILALPQALLPPTVDLQSLSDADLFTSPPAILVSEF